MNIKDVAKEVAPLFGLSVNKTELVIRAAFTLIGNEMAAGNEVSTPMGIFRSRIQAERSGVMSLNGQAWVSPEKRVPKLDFSRPFRNQVAAGEELEIKSPLTKKIQAAATQLELSEVDLEEDLTQDLLAS